MITLLEMLDLLRDAYEDASKKNNALIKFNCDFFNKIVVLTNENRELKKENKELKQRTDNQKETENKTLQYKYNVLERKYWDAQRTIDQYAQENEDLKKERTLCSTRIRTYKLKNDISKSEYNIDGRTAKFWQNRYEEANKERINLRNKLTVEKVKRENAEKYLVGYQKLYSAECETNRELRKQTGKTPELDALNAMETLVDLLNRGKGDGTDNKS